MKSALHISCAIRDKQATDFSKNKQESRIAAQESKQGLSESCVRLRTSLFQPPPAVLEIIWPRRRVTVTV